MRKALTTALVLALACGKDTPPQTGGPQPGAGKSSSSPVACAETVNPSALATGVQSLGTHVVGDPVTFQVPDGAIGFEIVEQATSAPAVVTVAGFGDIDNTAVPLRVSDPSGHRFFDDASAAPTDLTAQRLVFLSSSPGTGTLTFPNTSAGLSLVASSGLPPGAWSLVVSDYAYECALDPALGCADSGSRSSAYDVTVVTKSASGAIPATGTIDVEFYFATTDGAGGTPLTAATANAGTDRDLARMVSTFTAIESAAGVTVSRVHFNDLPADVVAAYAAGVNADESGPCADVPQLLRNARPGNALNIFLVSRFESSSAQAGTTIVGVDGTIPGPSSFGGTVASGAVVQVSDLRHNRALCTGAPRFPGAADDGCGADDVAYFVAHEAGHFLGLYHTAEADGLWFDPLSGTPECPCSACAHLAAGEVCDASPPAGKTSHAMTRAECAPPTARPGCGGGDNLMFWLFDAGASPKLSADQAQVMRANPLIQ